MNFMTACILLILFIAECCECGGAGGSPYIKRKRPGVPPPAEKSIYIPLIEHLFEPYVALAMPVCKPNEKMKVYLDTWLYQLFDLDEPTQMLTIDVWLEMSWTDCGLTWNASQYNNIDQITVPASAIWHPDIIWYEALHGNFEEGVFLFGQSVARVRHDGKVQLGTQALLKSFCRFKIIDFPYDSQMCNLTFASWNKDNTVFELLKRDSHSDKFGHSFKDSSNGEWDVIGFPAFEGVKEYSVGAEDGKKLSYTEVTFQLRLRRKATYVKVYLIFPCALLVWVATLVFILPVECGEKIGLSVTILLSLIVFLLLVAENIPRSSDGIPILGFFFTMSIGLVSLSVLMTTIVLNVGLKTQQIAMPSWIKKLMLQKWCRLFCFQYNESKSHHTWVSFKVRSKPNTETIEKVNKNNGSQHYAKESCADGDDLPLKPTSNTDDCAPGTCDKNDWRYLAILLDRIFLIIYVILAIMDTIYIYVQEPGRGTGHDNF